MRQIISKNIALLHLLTELSEKINRTWSERTNQGQEECLSAANQLCELAAKYANGEETTHRYKQYVHPPTC